MLACRCKLSRVQLFATLWTIDCEGLLSMGFSRQEYRSGLPFPPPCNLPDPESKASSPHCSRFFESVNSKESVADSLPLSHQGSLYLCASSLIYYVILNGAITSFSYCEKFHMKKYFHIFITYIYVKTLNEQ